MRRGHDLERLLEDFGWWIALSCRVSEREQAFMLERIGKTLLKKDYVWIVLGIRMVL